MGISTIDWVAQYHDEFHVWVVLPNTFWSVIPVHIYRGGLAESFVRRLWIEERMISGVLGLFFMKRSLGVEKMDFFSPRPTNLPVVSKRME
jgi:hypothetical protein